MGAIRQGCHHRTAGVGAFPDFQLQRHTAEIGDAVLFGLVHRPAMAKNIRARPAGRAQEITHILDQTQNRHIDALEHGNAAPRIDQSQILRCRDNHRARQWHRLRHGELGVARTGRHIDHQHVEIAPIDLAQHLLQGRHHHRAAPDHRGIFLDQKTHRHDFEAIGFHRLQNPPFADHRLARQCQQAWQRGPVNIGIQHPDLQAQSLQPQSQIDRGGGFADAAFAGGHRNDVFDTRHQFARGACGCPRARLGAGRRGRP